jgi:hypothetical protein
VGGIKQVVDSMQVEDNRLVELDQRYLVVFYHLGMMDMLVSISKGWGRCSQGQLK